LRWQKLARYAAERGWALDVITQDPSSLPARDPSRLEELPPGVRCFGVKPPSPLAVERALERGWQLYRKNRPPREEDPAGGAFEARPPRPADIGRAEIRWLPLSARTPVRAYYAWLDFARDGRWARAAAELARRIVGSGPRPAAVISCGPPHMVHEAGRQVARRLELPLIMDLRDPWSLVPRLSESYASPLWYHLAERYERGAIAQSALVVANTEVAREAMQALYPAAAARIITVMNGFDDDPIPASVPGRRFLIAYAGTLYMDRNPRPLFRAVAQLVRELGLGPDDLGIEFIGAVSQFNGISLETIATEEGIGGFVRLYPPAPRRVALEFLSRATLLVNPAQDVGMAIPSKIFDYMRYNAWLLALAERGSAPELLLRDTTADLVEPDDLDGIIAVLRDRYRQHAAGERPPRIADEAPHYSRRAQAEQLFNALEHYITGPGGEPAEIRLSPAEVPG
jgi:hypothetical protein